MNLLSNGLDEHDGGHDGSCNQELAHEDGVHLLEEGAADCLVREARELVSLLLLPRLL